MLLVKLEDNSFSIHPNRQIRSLFLGEIHEEKKKKILFF